MVIPVSATGSALLGTTQTATPLSVDSGNASQALFGQLGSPTSSLILQIKTLANQRLVDAQQAINDVAEQKRAAIKVLDDRWISVKAQINLAQTGVSNGRDAIKKISDTVLQLRIHAANAGEPKADLKYLREQFDIQANKVNIFADSGAAAFNLVGNINRLDFTPNSIEYRNNLGAGVSNLRGTYAGSDFRIEADDGTVWVPELSTDILQAYSTLQGQPLKYKTAEGDNLDRATSTRNGLKLVSYDPKTKRITVNISIVPTEPPLTVTGTLKTAGIGVMQSWFYGGLETASDRKRALADLTAAEVNLTMARGELQRSATRVEMDQRHATQAFTDLSKQSATVTIDQQNQLQDLKIRTAQQYLAMQSNLQNLSSQQANYLDAFGGFVDDPFAKAFLNITV